VVTAARADTAPPETATRRLVLTAAEWAVLVAGRLPRPPSGFGPRPVSDARRRDAVAALVQRGVLQPARSDEVRPVPAVAADLELLARPLLTVRLDVSGRGGSRQGWFALGPGVVVGVLTRQEGGVELSLAPAVRLGHELARAVPDAAAVVGPDQPGREDTGPALDPDEDGGAPTGQLPLALLEGTAPVTASAPDLALAERLFRRTGGSLHCLVLGRAGEHLGVGQVSWLATDAGWIGLRPRADGSAERRVDLVPVRPADLGAEMAPTIAALLEETDERV
jgi:hypothetical protein